MQVPDTICGWTPSTYQRDILDAVINTTENLIIQACAGSGKTSTLNMICHVIPSNINSIAVCFNKSIQVEFAEKLPKYVECKTLHSVGFSAIRRAHPDKVKVEYKKIEHLIRQYGDVQRLPDGKVWNIRRQLPRLISLVLGTLTDARDSTQLQELVEEYGMIIEPEVFEACVPVINMSRAQQDVINFDDMMDHPLVYRYPVPHYDLVMVDEAQDLNNQQMAILSMMLGGGGRLIAVGDRYQAIYGFRGACSNAMDNIKAKYSCTELPLSFCYRCGSSIVKEAQTVVGVDVIQSPEGQHEGQVESYDSTYYQYTMISLEPGDLIVCRTNAPLVKPCLYLVRQGKKASIRGGDIGKNLIDIINRIVKEESLSSDQLEKLRKAVSRWKEDKIEEALDRNKSSLAEYYEDITETLLIFIADATDIPEVKRQIEQIFTDDLKKEISFSTIHRAKGLEASRVVYLGPELVPHPMALRSGSIEQIRQESNLDYVARTRAKNNLIYQGLPKKEDR